MSDYAFVCDSNNVLWHFWILNDVLYAKTSSNNKPVRLNSNIKWDSVQCEKTTDGIIRLFLQAIQTEEAGFIQTGFYTCCAKLSEGNVIFTDAKRLNGNIPRTDLSIAPMADGDFMGIWQHMEDDRGIGLNMQIFDVNDNLWQNDDIFIHETMTRGIDITDITISNSWDFDILKISINSSPGITTDGVCDVTTTGTVGASITVDLKGAEFSGTINGKYSSSAACQYYWGYEGTQPCATDFSRIKESSFGISGTISPNMKLPLKSLNKTVQKILETNKEKISHGIFSSEKIFGKNFSLNPDIDAVAGPRVGVNINWKTKRDKTGNESKDYTVKASFGGEGEGTAKLKIDIWDPENMRMRTIDLGGSVSLGIMGDLEWKNGAYENGTSTIKIGIDLSGVLSLSIPFSWDRNGWKCEPSVSFPVTLKDKTRGTENDDLPLDTKLPDFSDDTRNSFEETCTVEHSEILNSSINIMSSKRQPWGDVTNVIGNHIIRLDDHNLGCFVSREEYVSGHKESRLLYFECDQNQKIGDVARIHNISGTSVHDVISACVLPDKKIIVAYLASTLCYSGTIADYLLSYDNKDVYVSMYNKGTWSEPVKVTDNVLAKEVAVYYYPANNDVYLAWIVEDDKNSINYCIMKENGDMDNKYVLTTDENAKYKQLKIAGYQHSVMIGWLQISDEAFTIKGVYGTKDNWEKLHYDIPNDDEANVYQTRNSDAKKLHNIIAPTRGSEQVYYEACSVCKTMMKPNCNCGCAKKKTKYVPTRCTCDETCPTCRYQSCTDCKCTKKGEQKKSCDPNEISGVVGTGDAATQRLVSRGEWLDYTVYFENKATADVPAQEVTVDIVMNGKLVDLSTLEFGDVVFGNQTVDAMNGKRKTASFMVAQTGTTYQVKGEASCDVKTGAIHWYLRSYDASQAENGYWPEPVDAGFLPPNDDTHRGEGHITFRVKVRDDAPMGARVDCSASIVFDQNPAIVTSPAWFNWIGDGKGTASATGTLMWDAIDGATYNVAIWAGDPEQASGAASSVYSQNGLKVNQLRLPSVLQDGVTYFWQVTTCQTSGETSTGPVWSFELGGRASCILAHGWNQISLPFEPNAFSSSDLLNQMLFSYDAENGSAMLIDTLTAGRAYWLFNPEQPRFLDIFPMAATRSETSMELRAGWNFVGPTESDSHVDSSYSVWELCNGKVVPVIEPVPGKGYTLERGKGYWIYR